MRRALTIGVAQDGAAKIIRNFDVPYDSQRVEFAKERTLKESGEWAEILFASDFKRIAMRPKKPEPMPATKPKR